MKALDTSNLLNRRMDPYWRKARIAARLLPRGGPAMVAPGPAAGGAAC